MCQLTAVNLGSAKRNLGYLLLQMQLNSKTLNKDGFGVATRNGIYKSGSDISQLFGLAGCLGIVDDTITFGHVRLATKNQITNKILTGDNFSHPFEEARFILFHNGTLEMKDEDELKKYPDLVDSHVFLKILEEEAKTEKDFVKALNKAYSHFWGKFAFLIYDKLYKKYYAAKGTTAPLHQLVYPDLGWVINTQYEEARTAMILFQNQWESFTGERIDIKKLVPKSLIDNCIYELGKEIKFIGKMEETKKPPKVEEAKSAWGGGSVGSYSRTVPYLPDAKEIMAFLHMVNIDIPYFDAFLLESPIKKGLLQLNIHDIDKIVDEIIPDLEAEVTGLKGDPRTRNVFEEWEAIQEYVWDDLSIHTTYENLAFPYWRNDITTIRKVRKDLQQDAKE